MGPLTCGTGTGDAAAWTAQMPSAAPNRRPRPLPAITPTSIYSELPYSGRQRSSIVHPSRLLPLLQILIEPAKARPQAATAGDGSKEHTRGGTDLGAQPPADGAQYAGSQPSEYRSHAQQPSPRVPSASPPACNTENPRTYARRRARVA